MDNTIKFENVPNITNPFSGKLISFKYKNSEINKINEKYKNHFIDDVIDNYFPNIENIKNSENIEKK